MKRSILLACIGLSLVPLGGCYRGYRSGVAIGWSTYPYSGWYDGYYGSIYDGYWGIDNYFYFRLAPQDRTFRRGDRQHFYRSDVAPQRPQFQRFNGNLRPPPDGTRMPNFPAPKKQPR